VIGVIAALVAIPGIAGLFADLGAEVHIASTNGHCQAASVRPKGDKSRPSEVHSDRDTREEVSSKAELGFPNEAFSVNHYLAGRTNLQGEIYRSPREAAAMTRSITATQLPTREEMMAEVQEMRGEKIYEYDLNITGVTDYGVTLDAILSGKEKVPLQGTRFDVAFEGGGKGRLPGKVRGVDYVLMRADGRADLDVRATVETEDGHRIAVHIDGVGTPRANEPIVDLVENVRLTTAAPKYDWVNSRQIWGLGTVNLATGKIHVEAFMQ